MELDYKAIGKRIKIARINADMTQEMLSEAVELSPTHLSNIETGTTHVSLSAIVSFDCDDYEIRMIRDVASALKETLRRNENLRK